MLTNYLKIAFRTLWRKRGYAAINVVGLGVAFCICVFLLLTAYLHLTFDSFHKDGERIFQTYLFANDPENPVKSGTMPLPLSPALSADFPELEAARVMVGRKSLVEANGKYFDKLINFTDPKFLSIFSFPLLAGNRETALRELGSIVISENMAKDLFGTSNPVGKRLRMGNDGNQKDYVVTGVAADVPDNSSVRFDALARIENSPNYQNSKDNWGDNSHAVYVKLPAEVEQATFEDRLKPFAQKYFQAFIEELKKKKAQPDSRGDLFAIRLQKLANIHFNRDLSDSKGTPMAVIYVLMGMAFFILAIACINFINLSIARSFTRAREIGVRKSLGALKSSLFIQIWSESGLICFVGFLFGTVLAYLLMPAFNAQFGAKLELAYALQPGFIALCGFVIVLVTLVAGGYPAWQMARFNTVDVLKGKVTTKRPGVLRNALIVTQFTLSCLLVCCTVIAFQQVGHLRQSPLGFDKEQVISIPVGTQINGRQVLQRLRNKLANDPTVLSLTGTGVNLGKGKDRVSSRSTVGYTNKGKKISTDVLLVDFDYLKTLKIKLLAGRDFNQAYASDSTNRVIVTQSMAKMMGVTNPVGMLLGDDEDPTGTKSQIIGVVPDFRLYSVADKANPITMYLSGSEPIHYVFVRVSPQSLSGSMEKLQKIWAEVAPQSEFMGSFLDENVDAWYQNEEQLSQILSLASGIAILLSCIGLFAIALLMVEQRTKEIGIRKVMGASIPGIVLMLSRGFVKLVLIALCISVPLAWFGMRTWLNNYSYRIEISPWVFIGVGLSAILIALATVSFQSIKAALMNPVKSLRSE
ncbi:ABC transporter permease [Spirosoma utsteinense]|uniref:ABC-type antimicrobial peptide transport system permease subunit n=1 Tax=Spirosoma utsteinense TaxID=2585773 RepID=A0ABR6WF68_9BACT|nr:ABC transporter permease [Spirosoma utsteinense]MBC3789237.1 ABC-type antimicrobial peptide transport system permease subunit [Spirosoma utsteinense]MBC3795172.1 ABC-type antimicrobial peptide transport system permease subunit [Spirosoma utsteinense]